MKLKTLSKEPQNLIQTLSGGGLFAVKIRYKATEAEGELDYTGPKLPPEMWRQILSFFKWTQDTTQSESQVRLFVNEKLGTWRAWAFPQQAETGLSTKELEGEEFKRQRASLFVDDEADWTAWGTVHHHCTISAFQSGTDERDERDVSGLHITIGDMDKAQHSIHARLYHRGMCFEPDMSRFWDVAYSIDRIPDFVKRLLPSNFEDALARDAMCQPSNDPFPDQWKLNLIKIERTKPNLIGDLGGYNDPLPDPKTKSEGAMEWFGGDRYVLKKGDWVLDNPDYFHQNNKPGVNDSFRAGHDEVDELLTLLDESGYTEHDIEAVLSGIISDNLTSTIFEACAGGHITAEDILDQMQMKGVQQNDPVQQQDIDPNWMD